MIQRSPSAGFLAWIAVIALVGCGGGASGVHVSPSVTGNLPPPSATPSASAIAGPGIREGATGYSFTPRRLAVTRGTAVTVSNVSQVPITHTFTIRHHNIDVVLDPGESKALAIELPPGTYRFICRFHVALGMRGTLVVSA